MAEKKVEGKQVIQPGFLSVANKEALELSSNLDKLAKSLTNVAKEQKVILEQSKDPKSAAEQKKRNEALDKSVQTRKALGEVQKKNVAIKKEVKKITTAEIKDKLKLQQQNTAIKNSLKEIIQLENKNLGTLQRVAIESKRLRRERERLNLNTKTGTKRLIEINAQLDKNNTKVKQNSDKLKQQRLNVGNYSDSIKNAAASSGLFSRQLFILTQIQTTLSALTNKNTAETTANAAATKSAAVASGGFSKALKILKFALIGTGIGVIVIALGALITAFATTQRGADALSRVITPLKVVFEKFVGFLQVTGFKIFDRLKEAFENPQQAIKDLGQAIVDNLVNRFTALADLGAGLGKVLKGIFTQDFKLIKEGGKEVSEAALQAVTGVKDLAEAVKGTLGELSKEMKLINKEADTLVNLQIQFERLQIDTTVALAKAKFEFQEQKGIANDMLATNEKRIIALKEAAKQLLFISKTEKGLLQLQIQKLELEQTFNDTDREGELELAILKAELFEKDAFAQKKINGLISLRTSLEKQSNTLREKGVKLSEKDAEKLRLQAEKDRIQGLKDVETDKKNEIKTLETQLIQLDNLKNQGVENDQERADKEVEIQQAKLQLILDNENASFEERERAKALFDKFEIDQANKKQGELDKIEKAARDKRIAVAKEFTSILGQELNKRRNDQIKEIDQQLSDVSEAITKQQELANDGKKNQLQFEKDNQAKLELERKKAAEKAKREQELIALSQRFFDALKLRQNEEGADPNTALVKAIGDTVLIREAAKSIVQFAKEGEEYVTPNGEGGKAGVDDIHYMLTRGEAVITEKGNRENRGVAKALNDGSFSDMYMPRYMANDSIIRSTDAVNSNDMSEIVTQNKEQIKLLTAIKNKPSQILDINKYKEIVSTIIENETKKTTTYKGGLRG